MLLLIGTMWVKEKRGYRKNCGEFSLLSDWFCLHAWSLTFSK
jgi:hypothetical protein